MDFFILAFLGAIQGLTEFLPISSTGHLILAREVFNLSPENGLAIDAVLQLATALAVVVYFWKDIRTVILGKDRRLLAALIAGTVPAVIIGLFLESSMETVFRSAELVAYALLGGSLIMLAAEFAEKKYSLLGGVETIGWKKGIAIGLFQSLALIPGMSRSGMTISGGLFLGLTREAAARFGFLLSVPIILGSGLKKLLELGGEGVLSSVGLPLLLGGFVAFITGILAIHALLLFLRTQPLYAFVAYRVGLAVLILLLL